MPLPSDLISEFVEVTAEHVDVKSDGSTVYGTIVVQNEVKYVQLDGSDILTPIDSTTESLDGDRVMVLIKNHTATVTGNISNNSASVGTTTQITNDLIETNTVLAENILATNGRFENLSTTYAKIETLEAEYAKIETLESDYAKISILEAGYATIENLNAANANIEKLDTEKLSADEADIKYAKIESLDATYANIDFANIGEAALNKIFAESGLIKDITIGDSTITGELVGVTIKGDLIEANTLKADKLVVKGEDGLYYKLNFESGNFSGSDVVPDDSLHGSIITANSITAEKISVKDLVAFDATIGGFIIDNDSIHSSVKTTVDNTTRGIYMDNDGQFAIGDAANYLKYYKQADGTYKLDVSAASIILGGSSTTIEDAIDKLQTNVDSACSDAADAVTMAENAQSSVENLAIGGRNYLRDTRHMGEWYTANSDIIQGPDDIAICDLGIPESRSYAYYIYSRPFIKFSSIRGMTVTASMKIRSDLWAGNTGDRAYVSMRLHSADSDSAKWYRNVSITNITSEWTTVSVTATFIDDYFSSGRGSNPNFTIDDSTRFSIEVYNYSTSHLQIKQLKLEIGNRATDWSPAPEDVDTDISENADRLKEEIDANYKAVQSAQLIIDSLRANISTLVSDANGQSMMTQDGTSWTFNISSIQDALNKATTDLDGLNTDLVDLSSSVDSLNSTVDDLGEYTEYIKFGVDNGKPCIILGETDSTFKVLITNTDIRFMEGSTIPASISNQSLNISKAVISDELVQGEFAWMARPNGNYGLLWRGA